MARTSKTRIGGESGEQAERQLRAAESGFQSRQRAHEGLMHQGLAGQEQINRGAGELSELLERQKGREQQEAQFSQEMAQRREFEVGRQSLQQQELDLTAAARGQQRQPGAPTSPLVDERQKQVEAEMARGGAQTEALYGPQAGGAQGPPTAEQQRQSRQMGKTDLEHQGQSFGLNEQGRAQMGIEATKAQAGLIKAQAYQQSQQISYAKAYRQGNKEEMAAVKQKLMAPVLADRKLEEAFATGAADDSTWSKIESLAKDSPDPELQKEIKERVPGPRVRSFVSAATAKSSLQFVVGTEGELPDQIDLNNPNLRGFVKEVEKVGMMIGTLEAQSQKVGLSMTRWMGINSYDDKLRVQNKLGAMSMLSGMNRIKAPPTPAAPQPQQQAQPEQVLPQEQYARDLKRRGGPPVDVLRF